MSQPTEIILANLGAPSKLEEIQPFLKTFLGIRIFCTFRLEKRGKLSFQP